jgi:2-polyprenyl-6-methoxyphenol hydroxylase-like FAD-dependent oxidoreductase
MAADRTSSAAQPHVEKGLLPRRAGSARWTARPRPTSVTSTLSPVRNVAGRWCAVSDAADRLRRLVDQAKRRQLGDQLPPRRDPAKRRASYAAYYWRNRERIREKRSKRAAA